MGFTLPMAGGWLYYVLTNDLATPTYEAVLNDPAWQTLVLVYIPALLIFGVLSVLHELKSRRESKILARLPEAFKSASDANERGLSVEESFKIVAENTGGELADELEQSVNETTWTGNLNDALIQFANSIGVPRLSRTVKLITKANEVSGDVQSVLKVAARDVEAMYDLEKDRKQNAASYIAIIIVSFLVSMFVIVVLDVAFLSTFESNSALSSGAANATESSSSGPSTGGFAGGGSGLPVKKFRMAFLHTTMTLGGASGIVAGSMASKDPVSGIKYSLVTMGLALAVFGLF
jgi:flagellar protein FlaJ